MLLLLFFKIIFIRYIHFILCVSPTYVCVCTPCACTLGAHRSQKRLLDPLELRLWMIVNHHVGAKNQFLCKNNRCS